LQIVGLRFLQFEFKLQGFKQNSITFKLYGLIFISTKHVFVIVMILRAHSI